MALRAFYVLGYKYCSGYLLFLMCFVICCVPEARCRLTILYSSLFHSRAHRHGLLQIPRPPLESHHGRGRRVLPEVQGNRRQHSPGPSRRRPPQRLGHLPLRNRGRGAARLRRARQGVHRRALHHALPEELPGLPQVQLVVSNGKGRKQWGGQGLWGSRI